MWGLHLIPKKKAAFVHINQNLNTDKSVLFTDSCKPYVAILGKEIEVDEIKSKDELEFLLQKLDGYKTCSGVNDSNRSKSCVIYFDPSLVSPKIMRCSKCTLERRNLQKNKTVKSTPSKKIFTRTLKTISQQKIRLNKKVNKIIYFIKKIMNNY